MQKCQTFDKLAQIFFLQCDLIERENSYSHYYFMPASSCSSKNSWEKYDDFAKTQLSKKVLWSFEMEHMAGFWLGGTTFGKKVTIINSGIKPFQNRIRNEHAYPLCPLLIIQVNLCQKNLFLHQLTHNMTKDCSLN